MVVSFRPVGKREKDALAALGVRPDVGTDGKPTGAVVMVGACVVLAFGRHDRLLYQDGSDAVPNLIRAYKRVQAATRTFTYDDYERIRRRGQPARTLGDILADAGWVEG